MNEAEALIQTSDTHPIRIDAVSPACGWGQIGMSFCPGKHQVDGRAGCWRRDLGNDLDRIADWGATMVVSLLETQELDALHVSSLGDEVARRNMEWRHLPIRDRDVPDGKWIASWRLEGPRLFHALRCGRRIFVHCKGGLGRTGLVAGLLLIESGMTAEAAISAVRTTRRASIETADQESFVRSYRPVLSV